MVLACISGCLEEVKPKRWGESVPHCRKLRLHLWWQFNDMSTEWSLLLLLKKVPVGSSRQVYDSSNDAALSWSLFNQLSYFTLSRILHVVDSSWPCSFSNLQLPRRPSAGVCVPSAPAWAVCNLNKKSYDHREDPSLDQGTTCSAKIVIIRTANDVGLIALKIMPWHVDIKWLLLCWFFAGAQEQYKIKHKAKQCKADAHTRFQTMNEATRSACSSWQVSYNDFVWSAQRLGTPGPFHPWSDPAQPIWFQFTGLTWTDYAPWKQGRCSSGAVPGLLACEIDSLLSCAVNLPGLAFKDTWTASPRISAASCLIGPIHVHTPFLLDALGPLLSWL